MKSFEELIHESGIPLDDIWPALESGDELSEEAAKAMLYKTAVGLMRFAYLLVEQVESSLSSLYSIIDSVDNGVRGR